ncbi:WSC-domain-containing protein [Tothia fuscella]|uniref:WSC-domain-containing protein n=1 Tax=Tothia fuscella TaxID=1048955 RepID=A0A9P4NN37_9PEZI|nr:WSC-domain-containing protein [Tothia fuscella]
MRLNPVLYTFLTAPPSFATFVVQCTSRLTDDRLDPIVFPDQISDHVHVIAGGSGFGPSMTYNDARSSACTTCNIKQDLSNYWTPKLYYQAQNGTLISVPIDGDDSVGNMGGMAIYYLPRRGPNNDQLVPFPKDFRMFAGDSMKRVETKDFAGQAIRHRCVGADGEYTSLPNKKCPQGVRTQVVFPSCWDGKNLDSEDHKSHVSYPKDGNYDGGRCPDTHPKHLLTLFYEVTYRTDMFEWYSDKQPFVFSNGDPTGFGYHGDFINGWDIPKFAEAIAKCPDGSRACDPGGGVFDFNTPGERQACKLPQRVVERVSGVLDELPGCNEVSMNPVTTNSCNRNPSRILSLDDVSGVADVTAKDWKYIGCGVDDLQAWGQRALVGGQKSINPLTVEKCVDACSTAGFTFAGMEYASECYCGKILDQRATPKQGILGNCNMKCVGDLTKNCGGAKAISLYQKCTEGSCSNVGLGNSPSSGGGVAPDDPTHPNKPSPVAEPAQSQPSIVKDPITRSVNEAPATTANLSISTKDTPLTTSRAKKSLHTTTKVVMYTITETYWA